MHCYYISLVTFIHFSQLNDEWTTLHLAAANGHQDCVQILIEWGADASVTNKNGQTPVLLAAQR